MLRSCQRGSTRTHVCTNMRAHTCMCTYTHAHAQTCTLTHVHMYTHAHAILFDPHNLARRRCVLPAQVSARRPREVRRLRKVRSRAARDRESRTFSSILTRCPPVLGPSSQLLAVPCLPLTWDSAMCHTGTGKERKSRRMEASGAAGRRPPGARTEAGARVPAAARPRAGCVTSRVT